MSDPKTELLLALGRRLGNHPLQLTLGTEGSCAVKVDAATFLVSRSGAKLATLAAEDLISVRFAEARALLEKETLPEDGLGSCLEDEDAPAPSSDTLIYAHLFGLEGIALAGHVQPVEVNQIISSPRARQFADRRTIAEEVIACGGSSILVPYCDAGLPLAREVVKKTMLWRDRNKKTPRLVLLQNHGMMVLGEEIEPVLDVAERTVKSARVFVGSAMMGGPVFLSPNHVAHLETLPHL